MFHLADVYQNPDALVRVIHGTVLALQHAFSFFAAWLHLAHQDVKIAVYAPETATAVEAIRRVQFWFAQTGSDSLADARTKLVAKLHDVQSHCRAQHRVGQGTIADDTVEAMVIMLALCARWNADFPGRAIDEQGPLW